MDPSACTCAVASCNIGALAYDSRQPHRINPCPSTFSLGLDTFHVPTSLQPQRELNPDKASHITPVPIEIVRGCRTCAIPPSRSPSPCSWIPTPHRNTGASRGSHPYPPWLLLHLDFRPLTISTSSCPTEISKLQQLRVLL